MKSFRSVVLLALSFVGVVNGEWTGKKLNSKQREDWFCFVLGGMFFSLKLLSFFDKTTFGC